ncbi:MAG TPA: SulP family inorganic anion transporter [Acidimicrobiales bacterium]|nr:SulP family inorganic anion transporter [Acidimicrobiales bacterium]
MGHAKERPGPRTRVAQRVASHRFGDLFAGLSRDNLSREALAGITLLAIAIPEQLATSQLAGVAAFSAMVAFIAATLVFTLVGANPIMSVGADSTIAPLFAVALLRLAAPNSSQYLALVAMAAILTGALVAAVGLFKLGWLADFLSLPIITGFLSGIGVIIIIHQLPHVLGVAGGGESAASRLSAIAHQLSHASAWSIAIGLGTLIVMIVGEKFNPRLPLALVAVLGSSLLAWALHLSRHGVTELGAVVVGGPVWRVHGLSTHDWGALVVTSLTLAVVVISQSAATSRVSADEIGVADDLNRDFVGVGAANVVAGLLGTFPVDASPARTSVASLAGGRTKFVGLVAGLGALLLSPLAGMAHAIPLAALAGVLLFIAGRLIKIGQFRAIWRVNIAEFAVAVTSLLGVLVLGVELGLGVAVGLAIMVRTWRSARPRMVELGRRDDTTSWEPVTVKGVTRRSHVLVVLYDEALYFANAGVFRRELHDLLAQHPNTTHVVIDAVAMVDLDFTGLTTLGEVVDDLSHDGIDVVVARASDLVIARLQRSSDAAVRALRHFDSVDAAVDAARHGHA